MGLEYLLPSGGATSNIAKVSGSLGALKIRGLDPQLSPIQISEFLDFWVHITVCTAL